MYFGYPAVRCSLVLVVLCPCLQSASAALSLLQWNPHWQCFVKNLHNCKQSAETALSEQLVSNDVDFANIVELEDNTYTPPSGWTILRRQCGLDNTLLIYNNKRWSIPTAAGTGQKGCIKPKDRSFIVQQFNGLAGGERVVIAGAHYPHSGDKERGPLRNAIASVVKATGMQSVVVMADTNEEATVSKETIAHDLLLPPGLVVGTELTNTCCLDIGYIRPFDRIVANFGKTSNTTLLFEKMPAWAQGQMHNGLRTSLSGLALDPQRKFTVAGDAKSLQRGPLHAILDEASQPKGMWLVTNGFLIFLVSMLALLGFVALAIRRSISVAKATAYRRSEAFVQVASLDAASHVGLVVSAE